MRLAEILYEGGPPLSQLVVNAVKRGHDAGLTAQELAHRVGRKTAIVNAILNNYYHERKRRVIRKEFTDEERQFILSAYRGYNTMGSIARYLNQYRPTSRRTVGDFLRRKMPDQEYNDITAAIRQGDVRKIDMAQIYHQTIAR